MDKQKVLIVDDEPLVVKHISDILEPEGYDILAAFNGQSAYYISKELAPNLIVLDWDMPVMDGMQSLKMIKSDSMLN